MLLMLLISIRMKPLAPAGNGRAQQSRRAPSSCRGIPLALSARLATCLTMSRHGETQRVLVRSSAGDVVIILQAHPHAAAALKSARPGRAAMFRVVCCSLA